MASLVAKIGAKALGKKLTKGTVKKHANLEDVYYDRVQTTTLGINRTKKVKKAMPEGLTREEEDILRRVKSRAYKLDLCLFSCCGIRFGWSSVIGIIPAIGDVIDLLMAWMVYKMCCKANLPSSVHSQMWWNMAVDFGLGLVPILGDIADGVYKCNTRNAALLEKVLEKRGEERRKAVEGPAITGGQRPLDSRVGDDYDSLSDEQDMNQRQGGPPPRYTSTKRPRQPPAAHTPRETRGGRGFTGRQREVDLEAGEDNPPPMPPRSGNTRSSRHR